MTNLLIKIFIKDYKNIKNVKVRESYGKFAGVVGIITNLLLFFIKITTGLLFHSISIVADAINNLSDSGSAVIMLLGFKISGKPADAQHPYGHARMEYIAGLIVSFIVMFLGLELLKNSFDKILHPQTPQFSIISIVVLVTAILIKFWQCLFYRKIGKSIDSLTLIATSADSRNDILSTTVVLAAAIITALSGINLDGYMGAVVALFILLSGIKLIKDTVSPLLGTPPSKELVKCICEKILEYDHIIGLHDLTVHSYGAGQCFASVHCEVCSSQDIMVSHDIIDSIERDFYKEMGIHLVIHLDPVDTGNQKTNELKEKVQQIINHISPEISMHDFRVVWGVIHSNLIFDVVIPFDFVWTEEDLKAFITEKIQKIDKKFYTVITVDYNYIS